MSWASSERTQAAPRAGVRGRGAGAPGVPVRHLVVSVVVLVLASTFVAVLAFFIAGPTGNASTFGVVSTLFMVPLVAYLVRWRVVVGLRNGVPALPWTAAACVAAYLVTPASWGGTALFWWTLVGPGPLAFVLDLPVWAVAVALGVLWGGSQQKLVTSATPYG